MRNVEKIGNKGLDAIPEKYDLTTAEIQELFRLATKDRQGLYDAICISFGFGFVMGNRATLADKISKKL